MTYYNSVVLMALAATMAKSTDPAVWNAYIPSVTTPGAMVVHSFAERRRGAPRWQEDRLRRRRRRHRLQPVAQLGRRLPDRLLPGERGPQPRELDHGRPARTSHQVSGRFRVRADSEPRASQ